VRITYDNAVRGCVLHASFLTASIWLWWWGAWKWLSWLPTGTEEAVWFVLLAVWPVWAVVLWRVGGDRCWRIISPVLAGLVVLVPSFALMLVIYALRHAKHI
jgi:hypothetical protein